MRSSGSSTALAVAAAAVDEDPVTWKRQNQCRYRVTDQGLNEATKHRTKQKEGMGKCRFWPDGGIFNGRYGKVQV